MATVEKKSQWLPGVGSGEGIGRQCTEDFHKALSREEVVYEKCHDNTDCRVEHTVERVRDICRGIVLREENDAEDNSARLNAARPAEKLAGYNQCNNADKEKRHHKKPDFSVRTKNKIQTEEKHTDNTSDNSAEEAVAAIEPRIPHIISGAEYCADAGEGRVTVDKQIHKGAESCGDCCFYVAHTYAEFERFFTHDLSSYSLMLKNSSAFSVVILPTSSGVTSQSSAIFAAIYGIYAHHPGTKPG